jgi:hypothetical protein
MTGTAVCLATISYHPSAVYVTHPTRLVDNASGNLAVIKNAISSAQAPIHGLVAMGSQKWEAKEQAAPNALEEPYAHPGIYSAAVCSLRWADMQPIQGGSLVTTTLDNCLVNIAAYNVAYPTTPMTAKLRVFGGRQAPQWAKELDGGPLTVLQNGPYTTGYWWTADYRSAWASFQAALSALYDGNPLIQEVAITSCAEIGAEPFVVAAGTIDRQTLHAAGYTDAQENDCLNAAVPDFSGWANEALDFDFASFEAIDTGHLVRQPAVTEAVMAAFRTSVPGGVFANHCLQSPLTGCTSYPIFAYFTSPVAFQTGSQPDCTADTFNAGLAAGMTEFEVWDTVGTNCHYTVAQLQSFAGTLGGY